MGALLGQLGKFRAQATASLNLFGFVFLQVHSFYSPSNENIPFL